MRSSNAGALRVANNGRHSQGSLTSLGATSTLKSLSTASWGSGRLSTESLNADMTLEERAHAVLSRKLKTRDSVNQVDERSKGYDTVRGEMMIRSMDKLKSLAVSRFGSMENMATAFGKAKGEQISLEEFSTNFRRRNLDIRFTREDQRLIYELFDRQHEDYLPVDFLLEHEVIGDSSSSDSLVNHDKVLEKCQLEEIKSKFSEAIEKHRIQKKLPLNQQQAEKQVINSLAQDTQCRGVIEVGSLRRALLDQLNLALSDKDVAFLLSCAKQTHGETLSLHNLVRFLRVTDMDLDANTVGDARSATITLLKRRLKAIKNHRGSAEVSGRIQELQSTIAASAAKLSEDSPSHRVREGSGLESTASSLPSLHSTQSLPTAGSVRSGGKRLIRLPPHDWGRVGFGSGSVDPDSALVVHPEDQFVSRTAAVYTPFKLDQTSNSLYRNVISDAERECSQRRTARDSRYERACRNLEQSRQYRELEDLNRTLVQLSRNERKTESMLKYESQMFLEDLKLREKQPLNRMAKRPNTTMSTMIWGGSLKSLLDSSKTVPAAAENENE